ncbi:plastocyanin [Hydrogenophaga sp. PAMC20947]|nr:plastocyanin [Hydrogenophaga sp. PAMC20947]
MACGLLSSAAAAATLQVTVLARDGTPLPDAVVIVEPDATAQRPPAPTAVDTHIAQQKMQFVPAVSVIPLGSKVIFTNLDGWEHHVRGLPGGLAGLNAAPGSGFELRMGGKIEGKPAESGSVVLTQTGPLQLGCHIHGSMRGSIYVTDSPWAVKTDDQGVAMLPNLPEGAAKVRIWHAEQLIEASPMPITIKPLTAVDVPTRITPRRRRS